MRKNIPILAALLLFPACATLQPHILSPAGQQVKIATSITVTEAQSYDELATLDCSTDPLGPTNADECEIDLRNQAAQLGAAVLVIESRTPVPCSNNHELQCQQIMARAFKKK